MKSRSFPKLSDTKAPPGPKPAATNGRVAAGSHATPTSVDMVWDVKTEATKDDEEYEDSADPHMIFIFFRWVKTDRGTHHQVLPDQRLQV